MKRPKLDQHSLGRILIDMGLLSKEQLARVLDFQDRSSIEVMLGKLMIAEGLITDRQLTIALKAQGGLRDDDKVNNALSQATIAEASCDTVINLASKVRVKSRRTRKHITGTGHPAVTIPMLALNHKE